MSEILLDLPEKFVPLLRYYRHKALWGGRGSAKSHSVAEVLVQRTATRKTRVGCGRQFQNSIKDSVKELIEQKIHKLNVGDGFRILDQEIIHRSTGSRFSFMGLDRNPDSQKSLEGVDVFWGEEAHTFNEKSLEIIIPTIRKPGSEMIWTWNPRYKTDPVDNMFRGGEPPRNSFMQEVSFLDNPWFFTTELAEEMSFLRKRNKLRYKHVWLGAYDENSEAQIFQNTRVGRIRIPDECYPRFGLDFGFSSSPNALVKVYIVHSTRTIYIAQESFGKVSLPDLPKLLKEVTEIDKWPIIADSSRPEQIDYLNLEGFNVIASRKGPGSVEMGINWLQGWDIVIDPECYNMREEARRYFWKTDPLGKPLPIPVKLWDHGWDAVRYALQDDMLVGTMEDEDEGVLRI